MDTLGFIIGFALGYCLVRDWIRRIKNENNDRNTR